MRLTAPLTTTLLLGASFLTPALAPTLTASAASAVMCGEKTATIVGTEAKVTGTEGDDVIVTGAARSVDGLGGNDTICVAPDATVKQAVAIRAGAGNDVIAIEAAKAPTGARIDGEDGRDKIVLAATEGSLGVDFAATSITVNGATDQTSGLEEALVLAPTVTFVGGDANDALTWGGCAATVTGGAGDDRLFNGGDSFFGTYTYDCEGEVTVAGGDGNDRIRGSQQVDRLVGDAGKDTVKGRGGNDVIRGGAGGDTLNGGEGRDDVRGGGGADTLKGRAAGDVLIGGAGRDRADGSDGRDRCVAEREVSCER